jgi:peptidoglycan hydrolase-like protein with peptidoglycan-binding domain
MKRTLAVTLAVATILAGVASTVGAQTMTASSTTSPTTSTNVMAKGGDDTLSLQTYLESEGYFKGNKTGFFGPMTKAALKEFQGENGISATGFYGPITRAFIMSHGNSAHGMKVGMMKNENTSVSNVPNPNTKAADLRVLLGALEHEHVALASSATRAGFAGRPDFKAAADSLDANSVALSQAVGSVYGDAAAAKFLAIWRSHIGFFVDYTVAAKNGDKAGMDKAVANLGGYVDAISDFFSQANPNLPREAVHQLVSQHVVLLKGAVDAYAAGDYAGSYKSQHDAYVQIGSIADALAGAIVKQNPDKF